MANEIITAGGARRGFTLIEMITSMIVGVIICGAAASLLWNASKQMSETSARGDLTDRGAAAIEQMLRYLREVPQDECSGSTPPCLLGHAQITTATASEIDFGTTGLRWTSSTNTVELTTNTGTNWYPLSPDATGLNFAYFDRTGGALASFPLSLTDRQAVRRIQLTLDMGRGAETARLRTGIYLRNFMNEVTSDP